MSVQGREKLIILSPGKADSIRTSRAYAHRTSSHPSPRIAALRPLQLIWTLVLSSSNTFTFSCTTISRSVPTRTSTVNLARKEESSLSSPRLHGSSSEARSRKAQNACWGSVSDLKGCWGSAEGLSCRGSAWRNALEIASSSISSASSKCESQRGHLNLCWAAANLEHFLQIPGKCHLLR